MLCYPTSLDQYNPKTLKKLGSSSAYNIKKTGYEKKISAHDH